MNGKRKLLVTAPTSAVGSDFIRFLNGRYEVTTIGRRESDIIFDFAKDEELAVPDNMDAIVHFAAALDSGSDALVLEMVRTNITGGLKVCMAAKRYHIGQVIYISSIFATLPETSEYYDFYSLTKKQAEEEAELYCKKNNIKLCIIRPGQIFGINSMYEKNQPLLYCMIKNAVDNKTISIYGAHDAMRNYIFAHNIFRIIEKVIERKFIGCVEVIDKKNYRLSEIAEIIIETVGSSSEVVFLEDKQNLYDNQFHTETDYFKEWRIPFTGFKEAILMIFEQKKYKSFAVK